jgi:hypothetical protein
MSKPISRRMTQSATPRFFETQVATHDSRYDFDKRMRALREENAVLRRQARDLIRHNESLRMRQILEKHDGGAHGLTNGCSRGPMSAAGG